VWAGGEGGAGGQDSREGAAGGIDCSDVEGRRWQRDRHVTQTASVQGGWTNGAGLLPCSVMPQDANPAWLCLPAPACLPVCQVACILGAALVLFTSRSEGEGGSSYDAF